MLGSLWDVFLRELVYNEKIIKGFNFHGWVIFIIFVGLIFMNAHPHTQYAFEFILQQSITSSHREVQLNPLQKCPIIQYLIP